MLFPLFSLARNITSLIRVLLSPALPFYVTVGATIVIRLRDQRRGFINAELDLSRFRTSSRLPKDDFVHFWLLFGYQSHLKVPPVGSKNSFE